MQKNDVLSIRVDPHNSSFMAQEGQMKVISNDILIENPITTNFDWGYWAGSKKFEIEFEPGVRSDLRRILTNILSVVLLNPKIAEAEQGTKTLEIFRNSDKDNSICIEIDSDGMGSICIVVGKTKRGIAVISISKVWSDYSIATTPVDRQPSDYSKIRMNSIVKDIAKQWFSSTDKISQVNCQEAGVLLKIPKSLDNEYFTRALERELKLPMVVI